MAGESGALCDSQVFREIPNCGRVGCFQQLGRRRCRGRQGTERASDGVCGALLFSADRELQRIVNSSEHAKSNKKLFLQSVCILRLTTIAASRVWPSPPGPWSTPTPPRTSAIIWMCAFRHPLGPGLAVRCSVLAQCLNSRQRRSCGAKHPRYIQHLTHSQTLTLINFNCVASSLATYGPASSSVFAFLIPPSAALLRTVLYCCC